MKRTPEEFASLCDEIAGTSRPPVEKWNPEVEVTVDIRISRDGAWLYDGKPIGRDSIVRLFASILRREEDGRYFLVTPVEKALVDVEDAAFVVIDAEEYVNDKGQTAIAFTTNVDEKIVLGPEHPLRMAAAGDTEEVVPYVSLHRGLEARVNRAVFYRLVEIARQVEKGGEECLLLESMGSEFVLGKI